MFKVVIACLLLVACGSEADNSPTYATGGSGSAASLTEATGGSPGLPEATGGNAVTEATGGATAAVTVTGGATTQATGGRASTGGQMATGGSKCDAVCAQNANPILGPNDYVKKTGVFPVYDTRGCNCLCSSCYAGNGSSAAYGTEYMCLCVPQ